MASRFISFSLVVLAACIDAEGPEPSDLSAPPTLGPSPIGGGQDTPSSGMLVTCAAQLREGACERAERGLLTEDEATLGFTADEFLQLISGEHRAQVAWQLDAAEPSSELVLTVRPQGEARFVDRTLQSAGRSEIFTFGNTGARYYTCGDQLAVDAEISIVMPDGTLNETLQARVEAESGRYARILMDVPSANVQGSLRADLEQRGADQLTLALGITKLGSGLEGGLGASSSAVSTNIERGSPCQRLGSFSLAPGCPLGAVPLAADGELLGLSFSGALARLNATSPATLGDNGTPLALAFTAEPAGQCVSIDTPATLPAVLAFPGSVALESGDGRVRGTLEVQVTAEELNGELQVVTAASEYLVPDSRGLAELAPRYAILEPLTWSALELGGFEFEVEAREQRFGGVLRAIGGNLSCQSSRPCEEVCPGPGCNVSPAEKWAVRWGEMQLGTELPLRGP
ncbi:MAG: hypothetical protein RL685_290 [Pseudomonadota bacterium]|jgi:hypothetical protein